MGHPRYLLTYQGDRVAEVGDAESVDKTDTSPLSDFMILSLPRNSLRPVLGLEERC
jgi:hypothetical protein